MRVEAAEQERVRGRLVGEHLLDLTQLLGDELGGRRRRRIQRIRRRRRDPGALRVRVRDPRIEPLSAEDHEQPVALLVMELDAADGCR